MQYQRCLKVGWLVGFISLLAWIPATAQVRERDSVLVLHSYGQDFAWTQSQQAGIDAVFGPLAAEYDVRIEYLDALRHPKLLKSQPLLDHLRAKFVHQPPRLVMTSDNAAFDFARAHRAKLFPNAPIVFMGVNGYKEVMLSGEKGITGVAEDSDLAGTLQVLLQLLPQTKRIFFPGMTDDLTYRSIRATVASELAALPTHVTAEFPEYPDVDALLDNLHALPPDSAIVVMTNMRTRGGAGIGSQRVVELVSAAATAPVFTNWSFVVGHGAVGGSVIGGAEHGRQAAEIALRVLRGKRPEAIPVLRGAGKTLLFDHRQLVRFGILPSRLPSSAQVLFSPESTFNISRDAVWIAGTSFAVLLGLSASLILAVRRRRRIEQQVRTLNADLEQRIQERTDELRQQSRYLRTLVATLPLSVWLKDAEGRYLTVSAAGGAIKGCAATEMMGKTDLDIWPGEVGAAHHASDIATIMARQPSTSQTRWSDANGERIVWVEVDKTPVIDEDGTVIGTVGVARDISARKATEAARDTALAEAERLANARITFLAQMSHELRTPLNSILGYTQRLLACQGLNEQQRAEIDIIWSSGEHLMMLIGDILDFAKIDAGKLELNVGDFRLDRFLDVIANLVRMRAERHGLEFACRFAADLPAVVRADELRLRQVLLNLLSNAVKFTESGGCVSLHVDYAPPLRLCFAVLDTGTGIATDQVETVFRPFEQIGDVRKRLGGTGLGLPISQAFVRLMGGNIEVDSRPGAGSTFRFEIEVGVLPMERVATGLIASPQTDTLAPSAPMESAPLLPPSRAELEALHELALQGSMRDILDYADHIDGLDARFHLFTERLRALARQYRSRDIQELVERHMRQPHENS